MAGADPKTDLARLKPYLLEIVPVCLELHEDPAVICGVILRETWATWSPGYMPKGSPWGYGDGRHGVTMFQFDIRFHALALRGLLPGVDLTTIPGCTRYVCQLIAGARRFLFLRHPLIAPELLLRAAVAAYNGDLFKVDAQLDANADPDAVTTPGPTGHPDYGADVLARAARLRAADPQTFPPALSPA